MSQTKYFDISSLQQRLAAEGLGNDNNFESESSIQDCQALREKFHTDVIERAWISSEFNCKNCGRQLSIVDLFNSEAMAHSPEMIKNILESPNSPPSMRGAGRTTQLTCDCGHTDSYGIPEFVVKLKDRPEIDGPIIFVYTRACTCTNK